MVGPQLTLMGTRIEGVDIGALRSLIFKLSQGGEKRSAWTNSVARLGKMKITLTLIAVNFKKKKQKNFRSLIFVDFASNNVFYSLRWFLTKRIGESNGRNRCVDSGSAVADVRILLAEHTTSPDLEKTFTAC